MRVGIAFLLSMFQLFFLLDAASAEIYTYVDAQGLRHYTNLPGKGVPLGTYGRGGSKRMDAKPQHRHSAGNDRIRGSGSLRSSAFLMATIDDLIADVAYRHQMDPGLIKAVIKTESNFDPFAVSSRGAQGLMQLMPETARELMVANPFDVRQNIEGGTRYLRMLLDTYDGNLAMSLAAYNAGPTLVSRVGTVPRIPETMSYVSRVLELYALYSREADRKTSISVRKLVTQN